MKTPQPSKARRALAIGLLAAGLLPWAAAQAQSAYPSRPVRMIVGFPAGTGPDIVARLLAQKLSENWGGMGVIVGNKPGAGGLIAASEAARAAPDGYTLMLGETGQLSIAPSSYNKLPYDPAKDFIPVSQVVSSDFALLVNPQKVPARNVKEFVDWTRQQKGLFMATFGAGTPGHFGAFMFGEAIGIKPEPVHYKSTADALGGLFSGDVQGVFASVGLSAPQVKAGKLAALGTTGAGARRPLARGAHHQGAGLQQPRVHVLVRHRGTGKNAGRHRGPPERRRAEGGALTRRQTEDGRRRLSRHRHHRGRVCAHHPR